MDIKTYQKILGSKRVFAKKEPYTFPKYRGYFEI